MNAGGRSGAPERLSQPEFIAMCAMLFATIAFSMDAMLPAFPEIAQELTPEAPNRAQLIITSFVMGMGLGTLFVGPISDAVGRKVTILGGAVLYCAGAALALVAPSLELVVAARILQGIGAAGPRVVTIALIRDQYSGREMAKITSFVMMVFTVFPAVAPLMGAAIIAVSGWRSIFVAFLVFSVISVGWVTLRQRETHPPERRRPFRAGALWAGVVEVLSNRRVALTIAVQALVLGLLFANLASNQQVFDQTYGRANSFPIWFALIALISATASFLNSQIVERLGMRHVITTSLSVQLGVSAVLCATMIWGQLSPDLSFAAYMLWNLSVFYLAGLTMGNLNALAMEPMGHIAGMAASIVGAISTVLAVVIAVPIGLLYDGTPVPIMLGVGLCSILSIALMTRLKDAPARA